MGLEYVQLFADMEPLFEPYSDAERGRLMMAMMAYAFRGEEPHFDGNERFLWPVLKRHVDQCVARARETSEKNRANGAKGGRPRTAQAEKPRGLSENPENRTVFSENPENRTVFSENPKNPTVFSKTQKTQKQEQEEEQEQEQEQEQKQEQEQEQKRARARAREAAPPAAAPDHLREATKMVTAGPENRSENPNGCPAVAKNATTARTGADDGPVIAFDGTDLSESRERYDAVERLIKRYRLSDNDRTLDALLEDAEHYGLTAVENALSRAAMSDTRGGLSVNYYRAFLTQATPRAAPPTQQTTPQTTNPFLQLLQREEEKQREQDRDT